MGKRASPRLLRSASRSGRTPSSAPAIPAPGDVFGRYFSGGCVRQRSIDRAGLLRAVDGEGDFVSVQREPHLRCVEAVDLDRDRAGGVGPRAAEILNLEN